MGTQKLGKLRMKEIEPSSNSMRLQLGKIFGKSKAPICLLYNTCGSHYPLIILPVPISSKFLVQFHIIDTALALFHFNDVMFPGVKSSWIGNARYDHKSNQGYVLWPRQRTLCFANKARGPYKLRAYPLSERNPSMDTTFVPLLGKNACFLSKVGKFAMRT